MYDYSSIYEAYSLLVVGVGYHEYQTSHESKGKGSSSKLEIFIGGMTKLFLEDINDSNIYKRSTGNSSYGW